MDAKCQFETAVLAALLGSYQPHVTVVRLHCLSVLRHGQLLLL
jgi:hypothetical protein